MKAFANALRELKVTSAWVQSGETENKKPGASEPGQCVKVLAVKLDDLSLIPWTYMVERETEKGNQLPQVSF